jgi:hypothetical protein
MALLHNDHVKSLANYLPFDASYQQLYAEYADPNEANPLDTQTFNYVENLLSQSNTHMIILTGDAGHGKTYLCRLLLEKIGYTKDQSKEELLLHGSGDHVFHPKNGEGRPLRIFKDLSDFDEPVAADILSEKMQDDGVITLVCANEGRLRSVVSHASDALGLLITTLEEGMDRGVTTIKDGLYVINLNFQSVTSITEAEDSLTHQLLRNWVGDRRRWTKCKTCEAQEVCPIYHNHRQLAGEDRKDQDAKQRREALVTVLRIAEQSGHVITIRELLILIAYVITGDLKCGDVHERYHKKSNDRTWQYEFIYHQLLFERRLSPDQASSLPIIHTMYKLDPGSVAFRIVDEKLSAHPDRYADLFDHDNPDDDSAPPKKLNDARRFAKRYREHMKYLRRRDYFEQNTVEEGEPEIRLTRRLGLEFYDEFNFIIDEDNDNQRTINVRDSLLKGLEAAQGIRRNGNMPNFSIVDPAFSSGNGEVGILSLQISNQSIEIKSRRKVWQEMGSTDDHILPKALNWLDRHIAVVFKTDQNDTIVLDLLQFEFLMRASRGLSCLLFFQADIRRIMARLTTIGTGAQATDEIRVLHGNTAKILTIDHGNIIRCG